MPDDPTGDIFAIPDFWKTSRWLEQSSLPLRKQTAFFGLEIHSGDQAPKPAKEGLQLDRDSFFRLPSILNGLTTEEKQISKDAATAAPVTASPPLRATLEDDIWLLQDSILIKTPEYKTWDSFDSETLKDSVPLFVTEAGPGVYDALNTSTREATGQSEHVLDANSFCACLIALALGRNSLLFTWDSTKRSFVPALDRMKASGYSTEVLHGVRDACLESGNSIRFLRAFIERSYASRASPSRVSLANCVDRVLLTVQRELGGRSHLVKSLLQLQAAIRPVQNITKYFKRLVLSLSKSSSDEELLSLLFEEAQLLEHGEALARGTIREVLRAVSRPWTDFVEGWIGLEPEKGLRLTKDGPGKSFVKIEDRAWVDDMGFDYGEPDFFLDDEKMPSFVPEEIGQSLFETGRNLRFLWTHHPEHPLSNPATAAAADPPPLEWQFDWDSITRVERKALAYEQALSRAIQDAHPTNAHAGIRDLEPPRAGQRAAELQFFGKDEDQIERGVLASIAELDRPIIDRADDELSKVLRRQLFGTEMSTSAADDDFTPHWSLLPLLSFGPVVSAQARIVSRECMRLLFSTHNLREHLALQRNFQLLGNGVFCSRLSHALFDPDLDTAERQAGVALSGGVMGLRLSDRESWPPASSELRLALMGVLSESYESSRRTTSRHQLPGDLSFAVRGLDPDEMDRCMDPDSLEALDFLRLSYKPPTPLMPVMTPAILSKYDRIFKLLLRLLRMLYVVGQLFRDHARRNVADNASTRFRIEAHHFVSSITAYMFDTSISEPWLRFETWLDKVQKDLEDSATSMTGQSHSPDRLRECHEQTLDEILRALLLRKRQQPVLGLLEDIFALILQFDKCSRADVFSRGGDDDHETKELYRSFRKKVELFITVCRGLGEKQGYGAKREQTLGMGGSDGGPGRGSEDPIVRLLLILDMTGYYSKRSAS